MRLSTKAYILMLSGNIIMGLEKDKAVADVFDFETYFQARHVNDVPLPNGTLEHRIARDLKATFRLDHFYATLHEAAAADDVVGIERLLKDESHALQLNLFDHEGQTPLQVAVDCASDAAIAYLVECGALPDIGNRSGEYTAWTLAQGYAYSTAYMNVVPLMVLRQAMYSQGIPISDQKKKRKVKDTPQLRAQKPSKIIRLRRQKARQDLLREEELTDEEYLLNV